MTTSDFHVTWAIDDQDADLPETAAAGAARALLESRPGDPDSPLVFTVTDRRADRIHTVDLADPDGPYNQATTVWPRPAEARYETTLGYADALALADQDRFLTITVRIDQAEYLAGYAMMLAGSGGDDHWDLLHYAALGFGYPYDPRDEIVAVDGTDFLVQYTTKVIEDSDDLN